MFLVFFLVKGILCLAELLFGLIFTSFPSLLESSLIWFSLNNNDEPLENACLGPRFEQEQGIYQDVFLGILEINVFVNISSYLSSKPFFKFVKIHHIKYKTYLYCVILDSTSAKNFCKVQRTHAFL